MSGLCCDFMLLARAIATSARAAIGQSRCIHVKLNEMDLIEKFVKGGRRDGDLYTTYTTQDKGKGDRR